MLVYKVTVNGSEITTPAVAGIRFYSGKTPEELAELARDAPAGVIILNLPFGASVEVETQTTELPYRGYISSEELGQLALVNARGEHGYPDSSLHGRPGRREVFANLSRKRLIVLHPDHIWRTTPRGAAVCLRRASDE
jgi:hypothetical protein